MKIIKFLKIFCWKNCMNNAKSWTLCKKNVCLKGSSYFIKDKL